MNTPVSAQTRMELLQFELEDLRNELGATRKELATAKQDIQSFLASRSIKEPYQLLRSYLEGQIEQQKQMFKLLK